MAPNICYACIYVALCECCPGMTAKVHLIRHCAHGDVGHVLSGRSGASLTVEGRADAAWLAKRFLDERVAAIHSSPRLRARETAGTIGAGLGLRVEIVDALDEIDFGEWTGRSFAELEADPRWLHWNTARAAASVPNGETMIEATTRAVRHVETLARRAGSGAVLCVSHCDIIRGIVAHYLGLGLDRLLAFDIDPGSVSTLLVEDSGGRVLTLNGSKQ
jgi:ribonuclease H / adenosylcobalamin/alpha-ribazole phosphatase